MFEKNNAIIIFCNPDNASGETSNEMCTYTCKMYTVGIFGEGGKIIPATLLKFQGQVRAQLRHWLDYIDVAYNFNYCYTHVKTQLDDGVPQE